MSKRAPKTENIYSSAYVQALEQEYCSSCSAVIASSCCVSSHGLGYRVVSRIYEGGRRAVYTATVGAMLANNMVLPAYGATNTVSAGSSAVGMKIGGSNTYNQLDVYGTTSNTAVYIGGTENVYDGGTTNGTVVFGSDIEAMGVQNLFSGGISYDTVLSGGVQNVSTGGKASGTVISSGGSLVINRGKAYYTPIGGRMLVQPLTVAEATV